jgi:hypothetical protein
MKSSVSATSSPIDRAEIFRLFQATFAKSFGGLTNVRHEAFSFRFNQTCVKNSPNTNGTNPVPHSLPENDLTALAWS